jgi:hypothetical protein
VPISAAEKIPITAYLTSCYHPFRSVMNKLHICYRSRFIKGSVSPYPFCSENHLFPIHLYKTKHVLRNRSYRLGSFGRRCHHHADRLDLGSCPRLYHSNWRSFPHLYRLGSYLLDSLDLRTLLWMRRSLQTPSCWWSHRVILIYTNFITLNHYNLIYTDRPTANNK